MDAPVLRRHGDEVERLPGGYYVAHGRSDDTMNLGGIKVTLSLGHHIRLLWDLLLGFCTPYQPGEEREREREREISLVHSANIGS